MSSYHMHGLTAMLPHIEFRGDHQHVATIVINTKEPLVLDAEGAFRFADLIRAGGKACERHDNRVIETQRKEARRRAKDKR